MHRDGLDTRFATPHTRMECLKQRGLLHPPLGSVEHPALRTLSLGRNLGIQGLAMFICAALHGILISNCADLKPLNGHTGAVVQPSFCVSTLSKKSCLRTSAGG